jgi:hypothetical protein
VKVIMGKKLAQVVCAAGCFFSMGAFATDNSMYSLTVPTGHVRKAGDISVGFAGMSNMPTSKKGAGQMSVDLGFGDPNKVVGGSLDFACEKMSGSGLCKTHSFGLSVGHHFVKPNIDMSVNLDSMHIANPATGRDNGTRWAFAVSKNFSPSLGKHAPMDLSLTLGLGNGAMTYTSLLTSSQAAHQTTKLYGAVAVKLIQNTNLIVEHASKATSFGIASKPFHSLPLVLMFGRYDTKGDTSNHPSASNVFSFSYTFHASGLGKALDFG